MNCIGIVSFKANDTIYLMCQDGGMLQGFPSQGDAISHFDRLYARGLARGREGGAAAMIHFMHFEVRCHNIAEDALQSLMPDVVLPEATIQELRSDAGRMVGVRCEGPRAVAFHNTGAAPTLAHVG